MFWDHGIYGVDFFWLFILVIVLGGIVSRIIRSNQREKTIRAAIEKGVTLDPATLGSLSTRTSSPQDARAGLMTGAIVTFFVGCGLTVMGYVLSMGGESSAFRGLAAVGGLLWCISAGLFVARLAIGRG
ncbi:MAG TPA: hypothetical protein VII56_16655 [Rhizomicrobium sp.]